MTLHSFSHGELLILDWWIDARCLLEGDQSSAECEISCKASHHANYVRDYIGIAENCQHWEPACALIGLAHASTVVSSSAHQGRRRLSDMLRPGNVV